LQLAKFCLTFFEFISGPPYSGSIGNYGSYYRCVYPEWFQPPGFPKCASACPEGVVEALLISICFTHVELKVIGQHPTKSGVDVIYLLGSWQQDTPDTLCHSLIGTSESPPLVSAGHATKLQSNCQFSLEEALLDQPLLLVKHFFMLERLHSYI
jgi:hypothetical protein